jgi:lysozyme
MAGRLRTSAGGLELIKSFEGFRAAATRLPDGRWTIGYGHVRTAREGLTISPKDAEDLLVYDLKPVEDAIVAMTYAPLNQNQFDALVSLAFNISPGQFRDSDVLRNLNAGDFLSAAAGFDLWRKARIHGRVMIVDALVRRRAAEKALFLEHPDGRPSAPTPLVTPELDLGAGEHPSKLSDPVGQPRPREAEDDEQPSRPLSGDIAEAVRRLAERTNEAITPPAEVALPPGARPVPPEAPRPAPPRTAGDIEEARRVVAERVARIIERTEKTISDQQAAESRPATSAPKAEAAPRPQVLEGLPDFDKPAERMSAPRPRPIIDDTEVFDPGRDPAEIFAEAERKAKVVNGRSKRIGPISGRWTELAPWIFVLILSIVGFGVGLVDTVKETDQSDSNIPRAAGTVLAVFGMMMLMSLYFLFWTRKSDDEIQ